MRQVRGAVTHPAQESYAFAVDRIGVALAERLRERRRRGSSPNHCAGN